MKFEDFIQPEIDEIVAQANFTEEEKETIKELVTANLINFNGSSSNVYFSKDIASFKELKEAIL